MGLNDDIASRLIAMQAGSLRKGAQISNSMSSFLDQAERDINKRIRADTGHASRSAGAIARKYGERIGEALEEELMDFAERRAQAIATDLQRRVGIKLEVPDRTGSLKIMKGTVSKWMGDSSELAAERAKNAVRQGLDGEASVKLLRAHTKTLARSGTTAAHNAAVLAIAKMNAGFIQGVLALATLDSRTSEICNERHGGAWDNDGNALPWSTVSYSFPGRPPWHFNCRTTLSPIIQGEDLPGDETLDRDQWFDGQDAADTLGPDQIAQFQRGETDILYMLDNQPDQNDVANQRLDALEKVGRQKTKVSLSDFKVDEKFDTDAYSARDERWKTAVTQNVDLSELVATRADIEVRRVKTELDEAKAVKIQVIRKDGKLYVINGHPALMAEKLRGNQQTQVLILDHGEAAPAVATPPPPPVATRNEFDVETKKRLTQEKALQLAGEFSGTRGNKDSWTPNEVEIEAALVSQFPSKSVARDKDGKIVGAIAYDLDKDEKVIRVDHLGSVKKGAGSTLFDELVAKADAGGHTIRLVSSNEAKDFYAKRGFVKSPGSDLLIRKPKSNAAEPPEQNSVTVEKVEPEPTTTPSIFIENPGWKENKKTSRQFDPTEIDRIIEKDLPSIRVTVKERSAKEEPSIYNPVNDRSASKKVKSGMSALDDKTKALIAKSGAHVIITDKDSSNRNIDASGTFSNGSKAVRINPNGTRIERTTLHEIGHAVDYSTEDFSIKESSILSSTPLFLKALNLDRKSEGFEAGLRAYGKGKGPIGGLPGMMLEYADTNNRETWAELFVTAIGTSNPSTGDFKKLVAAHEDMYPNTLRAMRAILNKWRNQ